MGYKTAEVGKEGELDGIPSGNFVTFGFLLGGILLFRIDYLRSFNYRNPSSFCYAVRLGGITTARGGQRAGQLRTFRHVKVQLLGPNATDHHLQGGPVVRKRSLGPEEPERQVPSFQGRLGLHPPQMVRQILQLLMTHGLSEPSQRDGPPGVTIRGLDQESLCAVLHVREPLSETAVEDHVAGPAGRALQAVGSREDRRVPANHQDQQSIPIGSYLKMWLTSPCPRW